VDDAAGNRFTSIIGAGKSSLFKKGIHCLNKQVQLKQLRGSLPNMKQTKRKRELLN
jgi:hypothetical protein